MVDTTHVYALERSLMFYMQTFASAGCRLRLKEIPSVFADLSTHTHTYTQTPPHTIQQQSHCHHQLLHLLCAHLLRIRILTVATTAATDKQKNSLFLYVFFFLFFFCYHVDFFFSARHPTPINSVRAQDSAAQFCHVYIH